MSETIIQTPVLQKDFDKKCINPQVPLEDKTDCVIVSLFFLHLFSFQTPDIETLTDSFEKMDIDER